MLHITERDDPSVGLYLNQAKSLLFILEDADASLSPLPPNIPVVGSPSWAVPLGPPSYCEEVFRGRFAKVKSSLGALRDMGDSQLESSLLCSCLALPKFSFILRTCPPSHICLQPWSLTTLCKMPWKPSWVGPCRTGRGSRHLFPAAVVVSTFTVLRSMLLLPSSPPGPDPCC